MAITSIDIGDVRTWLCAYNPRDAKAALYCAYVVGRAHELIGNTPAEEVHAWLRRNMPESDELLRYIESGGEVPRDVPMRQYPVTPGQAEYELPLIAFLEGNG